MDTPYGIFEYTVDNLQLYISHITKTPLSYIRQKFQIAYLDNYLNYLKDNPDESIYFIHENEYVDKYYLDDYVSYYAKCFNSYEKNCARVHFFKTSKLDDDFLYREDFLKAIKGEDSCIIKQENYLGFITIKPIPYTFLSNISLKVKPSDDKKLIVHSYSVSLFGILLTIDTVPVQEQDKVVSACATVALWSLYNASSLICQEAIPSLSNITKSAYPKENGYTREFPNNGLSIDMMLRSLNHFSLSSEAYTYSDINQLKEYVYAYISNSIPMILGVGVDSDNAKGKHALTILGYKLDEQQQTKYKAHQISNLYIHDDRYGAFVKIYFVKDKLQISLYKNHNVSTSDITNLEMYTPENILFGLYNKIRVKYQTIKIISKDLDKAILYHTYGAKTDNVLKEFFDSLQIDIRLRENRDLKREIKASSIKDKDTYLTQSLPKYIWSISFWYQNQKLLEMMFDATDIEQGDMFLGFIPYHKSANHIIKLIELRMQNYESVLYKTQQIKDTKLWSIIKYFNKKQTYKESLADLYGYLSIPEYVKTEEKESDSIKNQIKHRLNSQIKDSYYLKEDHKKEGFIYVWIVDEDGFLCIGEEKDKDKSSGHPTLIDGMPGRIGGELFYDKVDKIWTINSKSGRYSKIYTKEESKRYLQNVAEYKIKPFLGIKDIKLS